MFSNQPSFTKIQKEDIPFPPIPRLESENLGTLQLAYLSRLLWKIELGFQVYIFRHAFQKRCCLSLRNYTFEDDTSKYMDKERNSIETLYCEMALAKWVEAWNPTLHKCPFESSASSLLACLCSVSVPMSLNWNLPQKLNHYQHATLQRPALLCFRAFCSTQCQASVQHLMLH